MRYVGFVELFLRQGHHDGQIIHCVLTYVCVSRQDDADDGKATDRKTMWISILTLVLSVPALIGA